MRRSILSIAAWIALAGIYLVLAGTLDAVEATSAVLAGGVAAALGAVMAYVARRDYALVVPPRAVLSPLRGVLPDFFAVGRQLVAAALHGSTRQRGDFVRQPFEPGGTDRASRTRRAAAIIGVSLAPRSFVIRGEESDELLLHCLPEKAPSADRAWPA